MSSQPPSLADSLKRSLFGLVLFALVTAGTVALTQVLTAEKIQQNRAEAAARLLFELAPPNEGYQLDIDQPLLLEAASSLGQSGPFAGHVAYREGEPRLLLVPVIAPDGYTGRIELLVALHLDGFIQGVRVTHHLETPGLGDKIETQKSDWIHSFAGRDLMDPPPEGWTVQKEGGDFDQFTGATITPRAVVRAVKRSLLWFEEEQQQLMPLIERHASEREESEEP